MNASTHRATPPPRQSSISSKLGNPTRKSPRAFSALPSTALPYQPAICSSTLLYITPLVISRRAYPSATMARQFFVGGNFKMSASPTPFPYPSEYSPNAVEID